MALYTKESLETLRQRVDLVEVMSSHIDFKKSGASYKALCPFHDEKTPSFMIQKGDSHYHCFGCGAHGDAIQFLIGHLKMSFGEAVDSLAQKFNVPLQRVEGGFEDKGPNKSILKEAMEQACRLYHFFLLHTQEGHEALRYLYSRGLDLDFIQHFQVGLAPKATSFRKIMHGNFIKDQTMLDAGLLAESSQGGYRDFFYDRIMFPIRDAQGAVIAFSGRKYKEETFGGKYVNTPETPLFKKSRVLFGLSYCRKRIVKERQALIVEGQIDALRLIQEGFNITVAGQGTAFGEGHVKELINLGVNKVFLAMDGDDAGQEAACKIGDLFQHQGVGVFVLEMPPKSDPDSFLREHGPEAFSKLMENSIEYIEFLVKHRAKTMNMDSPAGKNELVQTIGKQIRAWDQPVIVHESLRKLAHLARVPESMVGVGQEHIPNVYIKKSASIGQQTVDLDRVLESDFLRWLLLMAESLPVIPEIARKNIPPEALRVQVCRHIYQTFMERLTENQKCDLLSLVTHLDDAEGQLVVSEILQKKVNREKAQEQFVETVQKLLDRNWMEVREEIRRKIQSGHCSDDEAMDLVKQFDELKRNPPKVNV